MRRSTGKRNADAGIGSVMAGADRVRTNIRSQVTGLDLPGKLGELAIPERVAQLDLPGRLQVPERVTELHIPERVADARRGLAARIEPSDSGPNHVRRRVLWIGLLLVAVGAAVAAVLARRAGEPEPDLADAPLDVPSPRSADAQPASEAANGQAPSPSTSPSTKN